MKTMLRSCWRGATVMTLLLFALGCSGGPTNQSRTNLGGEGEKTTGQAAVEPLHLNQFEAALSQYKGKVVLVDVWSIT